jgi:hypothetical protein
MAGITQPPQGIGEAVGIAREATYGVAVAPDIWWRPISNTVRRKDPWVPLTGPTGSAVDMTTTRAVRYTPDISGQLMVEAEYDDIGHLIMYALGNYTTESVDTGYYTHAVNLSATIPATTPQSFTLARVTELEQFQFAGCVIDAIEFSGRRDSLVTVTCDIVGQTGGAADVADAIGTLSAAPFIEFHDSVFRADFGSTDQTLVAGDDQNAGAEALDWTVRFENNFRFQPAAGVRDASGDPLRAIRQPTWGQYRAATMRVSRDYFDDNFFDVYHQSTLASAYSSFAIVCTSNEIAANSNPYELTFPFSAGIVIDGMNEYPGGPDVLGESITIKAGFDGTAAPAGVVLKNATGVSYNDGSTAIT